MSFHSMLKHRCTVQRMQMKMVSGSPQMTWVTVKTGERVFLDLNFVRMGKDPTWTPEAGRPSNRAGVAFFSGKSPVANGDRIVMTRGPRGTFTIEGAVDEAWRPDDMHHLEVSVQEQPTQLARGQRAPVEDGP